MQEKEFYRTVIRNAKTNETELIVWQSKNFERCLEEARKLVNVRGIGAGQIDILGLNEAGLWVSLWDEVTP